MAAEATVTPNTKIPLGAAVATIATVLTVGWKLSESLATIDLRLKRVEEATAHDKQDDLQRQIDVLVQRLVGVESVISSINNNGTAGMRALHSDVELKVQKVELALDAIQRDRIPASEFDRWVELNRASGLSLIPRSK